MGFVQTNPFDQQILTIVNQGNPINAIISMYKEISQNLLPCPSQPFYIFNLRDISRVFQGILQTRPSVINSVEQFIKLWVHEVCRVFEDRINKPEQRSWFRQQIMRVLFLNFGADKTQQQIFGTENEPVLFASYA